MFRRPIHRLFLPLPHGLVTLMCHFPVELVILTMAAFQ